MVKIYTKTGDQGETCLVSGEKVLKSHTRLESYGTLDELNSVLGLVRSHMRQSAHSKSYGLDDILAEIQNDLFDIGSQLANMDINLQAKLPSISEEDVLKLEKKIDDLTDQLPPLKNFILPGGGLVASHLHIARTVCRRGERLIIRLKNETTASITAIHPLIIQYVNRLSDLLFVMARFANHVEKITEVEWKSK